MQARGFKRAVHEWYDPLYRFALSLCRDPDDAQDLTQTTFQKLLKHGEGIRESGKLKSWLFSVLRREYIDQYRRDQRHPRVSLEVVADPLPEPAGPSKPGDGADADAMMDLLAHLEDRFREPLVLFYVESLAYREIADILDIPIGTVMSRLRRSGGTTRSCTSSSSTTRPVTSSTAAGRNGGRRTAGTCSPSNATPPSWRSPPAPGPTP
ncbi:MAG: RNA polymerase sigma factor [Opitutales bacterium]